MKLLSTEELEASAVVANCRMNRERNLRGSNGYERDLRFDPLPFLEGIVAKKGSAAWLDLCCGTGKALIEAAVICEKEKMPIEIVGVDLVGMFDQHEAQNLTLIESSLSSWEPDRQFDLITCVHGLHYVGDKLGLIRRVLSWLTVDARFAANLDCDNLKLADECELDPIDDLQRQGVTYSKRHKLLQADGVRSMTRRFEYLGADNQAGPNYTGQPAVDSWYKPLSSN